MRQELWGGRRGASVVFSLQQVLSPYDPKEKHLRVDKNVTLRVYCKDKAPGTCVCVCVCVHACTQIEVGTRDRARLGLGLGLGWG